MPFDRTAMDIGQPLADPIEEAAATHYAIAMARAATQAGLSFSAAERAADLFTRMLDHAKTINTQPRH